MCKDLIFPPKRKIIRFSKGLGTVQGGKYSRETVDVGEVGADLKIHSSVTSHLLWSRKTILFVVKGPYCYKCRQYRRGEDLTGEP